MIGSYNNENNHQEPNPLPDEEKSFELPLELPESSRISSESRAKKGGSAERRDIGNLYKEFFDYVKTEKDKDEDLAEKLEEKYKFQEIDLKRLTHSEKEKLAPHLYSEAITKVANYMVRTRSIIEEGNTYFNEDIDFQKTTTQGHKDAKKVFMNSCERLYPIVKATPDVSLRGDFKGYARRLGNIEAFAAQGVTLESLANLQEPSLSVMAKEDPKRLIMVLEKTIENLSENMADVVEYNTIGIAKGNEGRIDLDEVLEKELEGAVKVLYGLELTLDQLQDRVYGPDKSIEEIAKIKQVEMEIETSKPPEETINTKESEQDMRVNDFIDRLREEDLHTMKKNKNRVISITPFINGLEEGIKDEKTDLPDAISSLIKSIDDEKQRLLKEGRFKDEEIATWRALDNTYNSLPSPVKATIERYLRQEQENQKERQRASGHKMTLSVFTPGATALGNIYANFKKDKL